MGRPKRTSKIIEKAESRLQNLRSISPDLDFGGGLNMDSYARKVADTRAQLETYNRSLSVVDQENNKLLAGEKELAEYTTRMLTAIVARYGNDSNEYEMAGGVRASERKRTRREPRPAPTS